MTEPPATAPALSVAHAPVPHCAPRHRLRPQWLEPQTADRHTTRARHMHASTPASAHMHPHGGVAVAAAPTGDVALRQPAHERAAPKPPLATPERGEAKPSPPDHSDAREAMSERFKAPRSGRLPEPRNALGPPAAAPAVPPAHAPMPHRTTPQWLEPQAAHGRDTRWLNSRSRCGRCRGRTVGSRPADPVAVL